jgi:hypothetical protein
VSGGPKIVFNQEVPFDEVVNLVNQRRTEFV